ncbi:YcxB family protein [Peterkaempfera griseoplana]|uniref:YcxB family protein n=1 Tax=Peterkaempfera griseoplana TaxID=66896 RepID=UPI0006E3DEFA|nr:YcxB family protein [Peterkaempfera griseoplana]
MDLTATFQLTAAEFRSAVRNSALIHRLLLTTPLLAVLGLAVLLLDGSPLLLCVSLGLLVATEGVVVRLTARRSAVLFAEPWTVRVTEESYSLHTAVSQAEVGWQAYRQVSERAGFWYLQQTNGVSGFLPKRVFDDGGQRELAEFFARRLPPRKRPWYRPFA